MSNVMGRPTHYTNELADKICDAIASSTKGTKKICNENSEFPNQETMFKWLAKHDYFNQQYVRAKQKQVEPLVDSMLDIVEEDADVQRAKLKVDTYKWLACKLVPKLYGQKKDEDNQSESLIEKLIDKL